MGSFYLAFKQSLLKPGGTKTFTWCRFKSTAVPSLLINNVSKNGEKISVLFFGLSWFPQIVSLISCFSCTGPRSTIPLSLTRTHNNARNGCICAVRPLGNIQLPNSFNFSLCRASTIGLKGHRWGAEEAGRLAAKVARTVLTVLGGLDGLKHGSWLGKSCPWGDPSRARQSPWPFSLSELDPDCIFSSERYKLLDRTALLSPLLNPFLFLTFLFLRMTTNSHCRCRPREQLGSYAVAGQGMGG